MPLLCFCAPDADSADDLHDDPKAKPARGNSLKAVGITAASSGQAGPARAAPTNCAPSHYEQDGQYTLGCRLSGGSSHSAQLGTGSAACSPPAKPRSNLLHRTSSSLAAAAAAVLHHSTNAVTSGGNGRSSSPIDRRSSTQELVAKLPPKLTQPWRDLPAVSDTAPLASPFSSSWLPASCPNTCAASCCAPEPTNPHAAFELPPPISTALQQQQQLGGGGSERGSPAWPLTPCPATPGYTGHSSAHSHVSFSLLLAGDSCSGAPLPLLPAGSSNSGPQGVGGGTRAPESISGAAAMQQPAGGAPLPAAAPQAVATAARRGSQCDLLATIPEAPGTRGTGGTRSNSSSSQGVGEESSGAAAGEVGGSCHSAAGGQTEVEATCRIHPTLEHLVATQHDHSSDANNIVMGAGLKEGDALGHCSGASAQPRISHAGSDLTAAWFGGLAADAPRDSHGGSAACSSPFNGSLTPRNSGPAAHGSSPCGGGRGLSGLFGLGLPLRSSSSSMGGGYNARAPRVSPPPSSHASPAVSTSNTAAASSAHVAACWASQPQDLCAVTYPAPGTSPMQTLHARASAPSRAARALTSSMSAAPVTRAPHPATAHASAGAPSLLPSPAGGDASPPCSTLIRTAPPRTPSLLSSLLGSVTGRSPPATIVSTSPPRHVSPAVANPFAHSTYLSASLLGSSPPAAADNLSTTPRSLARKSSLSVMLRAAGTTLGVGLGTHDKGSERVVRRTSMPALPSGPGWAQLLHGPSHSMSQWQGSGSAGYALLPARPSLARSSAFDRLAHSGSHATSAMTTAGGRGGGSVSAHQHASLHAHSRTPPLRTVASCAEADAGGLLLVGSPLPPPRRPELAAAILRSIKSQGWAVDEELAERMSAEASRATAQATAAQKLHALAAARLAGAGCGARTPTCGSVSASASVSLGGLLRGVSEGGGGGAGLCGSRHGSTAPSTARSSCERPCLHVPAPRSGGRRASVDHGHASRRASCERPLCGPSSFARHSLDRALLPHPTPAAAAPGAAARDGWAVASGEAAVVGTGGDTAGGGGGGCGKEAGAVSSWPAVLVDATLSSAYASGCLATLEEGGDGGSSLGEGGEEGRLDLAVGA